MSVIILNSKYVNSFIVFEKKTLKAHSSCNISHITNVSSLSTHHIKHYVTYLYFIFLLLFGLVVVMVAVVVLFTVSYTILQIQIRNGKEKVTANTWYISVSIIWKGLNITHTHVLNRSKHQQSQQPVKPRLSRLVLYGLYFVIFCLLFAL